MQILASVADKIKNFAVIYLVDIKEVRPISGCAWGVFFFPFSWENSCYALELCNLLGLGRMRGTNSTRSVLELLGPTRQSRCLLVEAVCVGRLSR